MDSGGSRNEDVVITRTETAEEAEEGKCKTSDLERAMYNYILPVQPNTDAVTGLGTAAAVQALLCQIGSKGMWGKERP
jgi:hypothetical protein